MIPEAPPRPTECRAPSLEQAMMIPEAELAAAEHGEDSDRVAR
jgi:hypothetical protein